MRQEQDWFAHVTYIRPHPPLVAPKPYNQMYENTNFPAPIRKNNVTDEANTHPFNKLYLENYKNHTVIDGPIGDFDKEQDDQAIKIARSIYFGLITELDYHIGRLIDQLKQSGEFDSTLIIIQADHGEMLGDHHMWGKQCPYDTAFQIPLIIRDPYQPQMHGKSIDMFTESIDITPTILEWVGQPVPAVMDGHSLIPFLSGKTPKPWREHVFAELDFSTQTNIDPAEQIYELSAREANLCFIRSHKYKLIHFNGGLPPLLYDIVADSNEMTNLATEPEYFKILLDMTQKLLNHRMKNAKHSLSEIMLTKNGTINYAP